MSNRYSPITRLTKEIILLFLLWAILSVGCTEKHSSGTLNRSAPSPTPLINNTQSQPENPKVPTTNSSKADAAVISTKANLREGPGATYASLIEVDMVTMSQRRREDRCIESSGKLTTDPSRKALGSIIEMEIEVIT